MTYEEILEWMQKNNAQLTVDRNTIQLKVTKPSKEWIRCTADLESRDVPWLLKLNTVIEDLRYEICYEQRSTV
jgi:hypothetical protein